MTNGPGSSDHSAVDGSRLRINHGNHPFSRFLAAFFAALLALAPHPAFAQHGGGGGGHAGGGFGGSHGGGFGGGGHASGGSASRGGGASAPRGSYGGSSSGNSASGGATNSAAHSAPSSRFIGGSTWQAPPSTAMRGGAQPTTHSISIDEAAASGARVARPPVEPRGIGNPLGASTTLRGSSFATSNAMRTRPFVAQFVGAPPHVPPFRQRIFFPGFGFGGCFGPFFFGCGGFFVPGFGFGLGFWGPGYYCDAFWGCPAGFYGSYYNGGYYGDQIYNQSTDESSVSNEFNPSRYWVSAPPEETGGGGGASAASSDTEVVLFLKDGTVYAITDYWVADNKLHYVTNYGGENSIPLDQLDMQRTVDVNTKRGINITLRPSPQQAAPEAPPDTPLAPPNPPARQR
ncbi:MAG TPA: hypothetical protein VKB40_00675 [Candidatus Acidoferrales bacterium]|nr:hypothetical protein [Candidatus Acidoferrales bacterium]